VTTRHPIRDFTSGRYVGTLVVVDVRPTLAAFGHVVPGRVLCRWAGQQQTWETTEAEVARMVEVGL
jgi:hypothetical protein